MPLIQYFFKFLIVFMLVVAFDNPAAQLVLLMLVAILNIVYFAVFRPYIHIPEEQYNNWAVLHNLSCFMLIMVAMLILQVRSTYFSYDERVMIGNIITGFVMYSMTANVIYFLYRTYRWYFEQIWKPFVYSDLFKENYTLQYWDYTKDYDQVAEERKKNSGKKS